MNAINQLPNLVDESWSAQTIAARAMVTDLRKSFPQQENLDELEIGESLGPWRIVRQGEAFEWILTDKPSINDRGAWEMSRPSISGDKGDHVRVILIGESAAGSFGYWEDATIARRLAAYLGKIDEKFDVIDLTCVNASMELCLGVMKHALTLDPDYFVLYCGNNEGKSLLDNFDKGTLNSPASASLRWSFTEAAPLNQYGPAMVSALAAHCVNQLARATEMASHYDIPLLYILPESNSVDWVPQEKVPFHLRGEDILPLKPRGKLALAATDRLHSQLSAWESARSLHDADPIKALELYDSARELGVGAFVNAIPQTISTVADALREYSSSAQLELIDMPALFRAEDGSRLPDRRYFIDYCHLSALGITELASACAVRIARLHGASPFHADPNSLPAVSPRERFLGATIGAIHNYHYGQPPEIVAHWINEALSADWPPARAFLSLIRSFLLERARETITLAKLETHPAFSELPDRYKLFFLKFAYHGRFDVSLVNILDAALGEPMADTLLAQRKDDVSAFQGDLYSLFFMDCHKGIRPRLRGSNRTGWERPDLEFVIESPQFEVDIPPTAWAYDAIDITLELEDVNGGSLTCLLAGSIIGRQTLVNGRKQYRFDLAHGHQTDQHQLQALRFEMDHMVGLADKQSVEDRYRYLGRFGWYPSCGRILGLRLCATRANHVEQSQ